MAEFRYLRKHLLAAAVIVMIVAAFSLAAYAAEDMTVPVCASEDEAAAVLRDAMKDRQTLISLCLVTDTSASESEDILNSIFESALSHTGDPEEGDYLRFQYEGCKASAKPVTAGNDNAILINYAVSYYDSAEQEEELSEIIEKILEDLDLEDKTDTEKTECIYRYICDNTEYDYDNLTDDDYKLKHTAYAALADGKAVCQGYSAAFYRLLLEAGVDNRIIYGSSITDTGDEEDHTWNIVRIEDEYYNTDITKDDELGTSMYYLRGSGAFDENHVRDEAYNSEEFTSSYEVSDSDYGSGEGITDRISRLFAGIVDALKGIFS